MADNDEWAIFLNGTYGVGKSAALDGVGDLLAAAGQPFSLIDVDWFHRSWPPAGFDEQNVLIEAKNIAAVWANYRTAGPRRLVVSGVIADRADLDRYAAALALRVRPVRLVASAATIETRLRGRYGAGPAAALDWHLQRHADLARRQADTQLDETVIPTDALSPADTAAAVLRHFGIRV